MRPILSLALVAVSGIGASAAQQAAEVFILQANSKPMTQAPQLPKEVARHVLLQRVSNSAYGSSLSDLPSSIDEETAIAYITQYGKTPASLFGQSTSQQPSQLVMVIEGITDKDGQPLKQTLAKAGQQPAFTISDPPSASGNDKLLSYFRAAGIAKYPSCDLVSAINPFEKACWDGASSVVKYDAQKDADLIHVLLDNLPRLVSFVSSGDLEVTLVLMPESSRNSKVNAWTSASMTIADLRRRDSDERVMTDDISSSEPAAAKPTSHATTPNSGFIPFDKKAQKHFLSCYSTMDSCTKATSNCTGHGQCVDKYNDPKKERFCFECMCKATVVQTGEEKGAVGRKVIHWGGRACQKVDVSTSFWLLAGVTIVLAGAVIFAISLLFNVGEEELPGVIGAGVSKSK